MEKALPDPGHHRTIGQTPQNPGSRRMMTATIEQLWIYPVKSLAGISVLTATLETAGLAGDREWMIVDGDGLFLSQRKLPRLATIKTEFQNGQITLLHPRSGELPLTPPDGDAQPVQVQGANCFG